jgi:hypothetical protein
MPFKPFDDESTDKSLNLKEILLGGDDKRPEIKQMQDEQEARDVYQQTQDQLEQSTPKPTTGFPLLSKYSSFEKSPSDEQLSELRDNVQNRNKALNLSEALSGLAAIPASFKGGKVDTGSEFYDKLRKTNLTDLDMAIGKRRDEEESLKKIGTNLQTSDALESDEKMKDPNSMISQIYRETAKKILPSVPDTASAKDLENVLKLKSMMPKVGALDLKGYFTKDSSEPVIYDPSRNMWFKAGTNEVVEVDNVHKPYAPSLMTDPYTGDIGVVNRSSGATPTVTQITSPKKMKEGEEPSFQTLTPKQREATDKTREALLNDQTIKDARQVSQTLAQTNDLIRKNIPGSGGAIKRSLAHLFEPGRLTDQDVIDFGGSKAVLSRVDQIVQESASGKPFTKENQQYLLKLVDAMETGKQRILNTASNYYVKNLENKGVPRAVADKMLRDDLITKKSVKLPSKIKPGSIISIKGVKYKVNEDGMGAEEL